MKIVAPDRFNVIRILKEDGQSKTFLAGDALLGRAEVLVKLLRKGHFTCSPDSLIPQVSWFSGIRHKNLSIMCDAGLTPNGDIYFVREYLPPSELFSTDNLTVIKTLVSAVDFLQTHDRVHGAVKPSNVFVTNGSLKLTDPRFVTAPSQHSEEDIRCSAPEVLQGKNPTLESDLYSLGAVLYRVLTRRNLFEDANPSHLRAKHIWASPLPIGNVSDIPKVISDKVMQLLDREPEKRKIAFSSLKEYTGAGAITAVRSPFVGHQMLLTETLQVISQPSTKGLRVIAIEGHPGIGKSRLIEELRIRGGFKDLLFLTLHCARKSEFESMEHKLSGFVKSSRSSNKKTWASMSSFADENFNSRDGTQKSAEDEKTNVTLAGLVAQLASYTRLVVAIDGIEHDYPLIRSLVEEFSFRAEETPLTVILVQRRGSSGAGFLKTVEDRLGHRVDRIVLPPLSDTDSRQLLTYLEPSRRMDEDSLPPSARNPLFIENHAGQGNQSTASEQQREALVWMRSQIPKDAKAFVEALSLFKSPVELETIAGVCGGAVATLADQLPVLEDMGIIQRCATGLTFAHPLLSTNIYHAISKKNKMALAKKAFEVLRGGPCNIQDLAHYSFEAGFFQESARLYQQVANQAFDEKDFQTAAIQYERLRECERLGGVEFQVADQLKLVGCYRVLGKESQALQILKQNLAKGAVQNDPELLSAFYAQLATLLDTTPLRDKVRLSHRAIECLPQNSPRLARRYRELFWCLLWTGDLEAAAHAFNRIKELAAAGPADSSHLAFDEALLLLNLGDFKRAANSFMKNSTASPNAPNRVATFVNLALCFENLGDLRKALKYQSQAREIASAQGHVLQILTLGNLGSIRTKLGDVGVAEELFVQALGQLEALRNKETAFDLTVFLTVACDAAFHNIWTGRYGSAAERLRTIPLSDGSFPPASRAYCGTVHCLFYLEIGFTKRVRSLLEEFKPLQVFKTPYFQVEQALLEVRMPDISTADKVSRLKEAFEITEQLETLYQQCQVLTELAAVYISTGENQKASEYANKAQRLAQKHQYRLLRTRAILLSGIASEKNVGKEQKLLAAFQNASEMGLQELAAESGFHLGALHLECGNLVTAREYLSRSVSITEHLTTEIPVRFRATYNSTEWRRHARKQLERCNLALQQQPIYGPSATLDASGTDRYFKAAYNFALSGTATKSAEGLVSHIERAVQASLNRGAVITLKDVTGPIIRALNIKLSEELVQRIRSTAAMAKNRIYFGAPDISHPKEIVAWVPLMSETREGGIYVVCRQNEAPLSEKEMELLSIIGTIGNGALKSLEANQAAELENMQLAEFHGMVGASKAIREVYSHIEIASKNTATVLIEGESGTGKELVAKGIHAAGPRAKDPFIAVDCGALPETLIEAELFGAKKGSYTGALSDRAGLFEAANRGTIFLDEISNTTAALQARLLRVIQEKQVRRIGETKDRPVDVRLIAASNRNLEELVAEGRFRKDLLYRLKVLYIKVPPLRNHREDIPMIVHAFLQKLNATHKLKKYCAPGVIDHLAAQNFPGNVRELQNAVERAYFLSKGSVIQDIPVEGELATNQDEVQTWFKDLTEGRKDFWNTVHDSFKRRDITRDKMIALVDLGLRSSGGSYKALALKFKLKRSEYRRFMDFLRRSKCLLDFRPYRKAAAAE